MFRVCACGTGGSVVEFSPATREARVRFPASATLFFILLILLKTFYKSMFYRVCGIQW